MQLDGKVQNRMVGPWLCLLLLSLVLGGCGGRDNADQTGPTTTEQEEHCTISVQPGESIQAAIDAAPEGAVICLEEGEWRENLRIEKSLTLRGEGPDKTAIKGSYRREGDPVISIGSDYLIRVGIESLTVAEAQASAMTRADGVYVWGAAHVNILEAAVKRNDRDGVVLSNNAIVEVYSSTISSNESAGFFVKDSGHATIRNTIVSDNSSSGFAIRDSARGTLETCSITGNYVGVTVIARTAQVVIAECLVSENMHAGFELHSGAVTIAGCTVEANSGHGILTGRGTSLDLTVKNSTIARNERHGIYLQMLSRANGIIIKDCTLEGNRRSGILVGMFGEGTLVANRIINNKEFGVALERPPCYPGSAFFGYVSGHSNIIPQPGEPEGNRGGALCVGEQAPGLPVRYLAAPELLSFLTTETGGELDKRIERH